MRAHELPKYAEPAFKMALAEEMAAIERCAQRAYELERPFFPARQPPWGQQTLEIQQAYREVAEVVRGMLLRVLAAEARQSINQEEV